MTCEERLAHAAVLLKEAIGLQADNVSGVGLLDYDFNWRASDDYTERVKSFLREAGL